MRVPRIAALLAGVAAGALMRALESRKHPRLQQAIQDLEDRLAARAAEQDSRLAGLEARLNQQEDRLHNVPSTEQIVSAMEELLAKATASLDERLVAQAQSIDILKSTVAETDQLLERVLESLDLLRQGSEEPGERPLPPGPPSR